MAAISSYAGKPAIERARRRWQQANVVQEAPVAIVAEPARTSPDYPWKRGCMWRYLEHENDNITRMRSCRCCRGTGEMAVYIDDPAEPCTQCQLPNPWRRDDEQEAF